MKPKNLPAHSLAAETIDTILSASVRDALRIILRHAWITDYWAHALPGDELEHLGHAYYLIAHWLCQLEHATNASRGLGNAEPRETRTRLFLKDVCTTAGAADELCWEEFMHALHRHSCGDWGDVCEVDRAENDRAADNGGRIVSEYRTANGIKFWIITDAGHETTTVLLPHEY